MAKVQFSAMSIFKELLHSAEERVRDKSTTPMGKGGLFSILIGIVWEVVKGIYHVVMWLLDFRGRMNEFMNWMSHIPNWNYSTWLPPFIFLVGVLLLVLDSKVSKKKSAEKSPP